MAEGLARAKAPPGWRIFSAGSRPARLSRRAVSVMSEIGIDISDQWSKGLDDIPIDDADMIVTLCAEDECPVSLGHARRLHWPVPDPARSRGTEAEQLEVFRSARDEIGRRVGELFTLTPDADR
jgi:protein-tyrosine-phosphatase